MFSAANKTVKTSPAVQQQPAGTTFFRKAGEERFFGAKENSSFFKSAIHTKLTVSTPDDPQEKEADEVADKVMRMQEPVNAALISDKNEDKLQRNEEDEEIQAKPEVPLVNKIHNKSEPAQKLQAKGATCGCGAKEDTHIHTKPETENNIAHNRSNISLYPSDVMRQSGRGPPTGSIPFEQILASSKGGGSALPGDTQTFMESRFNADFSGVRVHTDSTAASLSRSVNAQAFAHGNDIYFNSGKFSPDSTDGKTLLAHELTHTVQQGASKSIQPKGYNIYKVYKKANNPKPDSLSADDQDSKSLKNKSKLKDAESKVDNQTPVEGRDSKENKAGPKEGQNPKKEKTKEKDNVNEKEGSKEPAETTATSAGGVPAAEGGIENGSGSAVAGPDQPESAELSTEDPGQIIEQLKNAVPTEAASVYAQAGSASAQALQHQKTEIEKTIPELPVPTGLPAKGANSGSLASKGEAEIKPNGNIGDKETAPESADPDALNNQLQIPQAPPAPQQPVTQLAGGEVTEEGQNDDALSLSAQNALQSTSIDTNQISTNTGDKPSVELNGEADPSQIHSAQNQSALEVQGAKANAALGLQRNFGENDIYPEATSEILSGELKAGVRTPATGAGKANALPGEAVAGVNKAAAPFLQQKIGVEQDKYRIADDKFKTDTVSARTNADDEIAGATSETKEQQLADQRKAREEVTNSKKQWQTELDTVDKDYQSKATQATQDCQKNIGNEKVKGEAEAAKHQAEGERKAEEEKQKADADAAQKKSEAKKESGGFWGWVKSKAKALIDGIKKAVNFIYDNLRKAVKFIFEIAKKLVVAAIELARKAIVGLIKGFGALLKGFVSIAFAAFPEIANRINAKIDGAVTWAEDKVNKAAEFLKKAVSAILDFLAKTLDSLLGLIQDIYNGILTVIGMIISGEFAELMEGIGNLIDSAKTAPSQFETAALEELLGGNLDEPLSPAELAMAGKSAKGGASGASDPSELPKEPWTESNVGVDAVDQNMELSPEMEEELMQQTNGNGQVMLGESGEQSRSMDAVLAEANGQTTAEGDDKQQAKNPDDGLSPRERAGIKWELMKDGISKWWSANWPYVLAGGVLAVVAFIVANILSGGAILAALPAIMAVVGYLFIGLTVITIAGHVRDFLQKGWKGDIQAGGKSLAKGLAAGAVELISYLTFKVGGAALKGAQQAVVKGAKVVVKGAVSLAKKAVKAVIQGVKFIIEKGKVLFKGIGSGIGKMYKKLKDLGKGLLDRMRFKAFRIRVSKRSFVIEGLINPWIVLAQGSFAKVDPSEIPPGTKLGDEVTTSIGNGKFVSEDLPDILKGISNSTLSKGVNFKDHFIRHKNLLENVLNKKYPKFKTDLGKEFITDLSEMIKSGRLKYTGMSTLAKGQDYLMIFRGEGLTAAVKLDGEWVTLLKAGEGMDLGIDAFMIARP